VTEKLTDDNARLQDIQWFRQSAPYINAHRGKTFVIMLPGASIDSPSLGNIITDLAILASLGIKLVVVHGARLQIDTKLADNEVPSVIHKGLRVTRAEDMPDILETVGATRLRLEASFSHGLPNSPMFGAKLRVRGGNFVTAQPQGVIDGVDLQHTGKVRSVDAPGIDAILQDGGLVLLSPLGYSVTGEVFNLNFAEVAVHTALALQADKLIAFNDDGPIRDEKGNIYRELTLLKCEKFLLRQKSVGNNTNTYFSLKACHKACDGGIARAHVIASNDDGALLKELFTRDGAGTMVYRDHYETIRRARVDDVMGILNLIAPLESEGILVKRSREKLEQEIQCFTVMEKDGIVIGCAALYPFSDKESGEMACMAISAAYRGQGKASKLLMHIERQSLKLGISKLFVLTTQTAHWFIEQGFVETLTSNLPVERAALYNYQRKSKVFVKQLKNQTLFE
jgi:amino-acid N-acetyltransferase